VTGPAHSVEFPAIAGKTPQPGSSCFALPEVDQPIVQGRELGRLLDIELHVCQAVGSIDDSRQLRPVVGRQGAQRGLHLAQIATETHLPPRVRLPVSRELVHRAQRHGRDDGKLLVETKKGPPVSQWMQPSTV
jgi:hypothetical protein